MVDGVGPDLLAVLEHDAHHISPNKSAPEQPKPAVLLPQTYFSVHIESFALDPIPELVAGRFDQAQDFFCLAPGTPQKSVYYTLQLSGAKGTAFRLHGVPPKS